MSPSLQNVAASSKIISPLLGKPRLIMFIFGVSLLVSLTVEPATAQSTAEPASESAVEASESEESALARLAAVADKPKKEKVKRSRPIQAQKPQDRTSSETMTSVHKE